MRLDRGFAIKFSSVYPLYVKKAESKSRSRDGVDRIIYWLTSYSRDGLRRQIESENDLETFFSHAPTMNPNISLIKGVVCGIRVEVGLDDLAHFLGHRWKHGWLGATSSM
jgi:hypothetical protein